MRDTDLARYVHGSTGRFAALPALASAGLDTVTRPVGKLLGRGGRRGAIRRDRALDF